MQPQGVRPNQQMANSRRAAPLQRYQETGVALLVISPLLPVACVLDCVRDSKRSRVSALMSAVAFHTGAKKPKWLIAAVPTALTALVAVWLMAQRQSRPEDLVFVPAGSDQQARTLLARMLETNKPWLEPKPLRAVYSLRRTFRQYSWRGRLTAPQSLGPYAITPESPQEVRVGALVWTPLHALVASEPGPHVKRWFQHGDEGGPVGYTVRMLGQTHWKGKQVIGLEITFDSPERCMVGTGGQVNGTYNVSTFGAQKARMLVDARKAIPLLIGTCPDAGRTVPFRWEYLWEFPSRFSKIAGGLAPESFTWRDLREPFGKHYEKQEFQIFNGVWIFKRGTGVWRRSIPTLPGSALKQTVDRLKGFRYERQEAEILNLQLQPEQSSVSK